MAESVLTPEIHATAARAQDELSVWDRRAPGVHLPQTLAHGEAAVTLLGDLIVQIGSLRDRVDREVRDYQRGMMK